MKYNTFFKLIIKVINSAEGEICSKSNLARSLNLKPHNIQKIIREFNSTYPSYHIHHNNTGYYITNKIPQNIIESLPGISTLNLHIAFLQQQILKSIFTKNYIFPNRGQINSCTIYKSTVESYLKFYGIPNLNKILSSSIESKIYLLINLPTYTYYNINFKDEIFFTNNSIYNINDFTTFETIKKLSSNYSKNILEMLGHNHNTSLNYYILFFYFLYEFIIYINNNNQSLENFHNIEQKIFDYPDFTIPDFCNFEILKSLLILELHLKPLKKDTIENSFNIRLKTISFYPLFGVFIPHNNDLIISTYGMYIKLINNVSDNFINTYTLNKLTLIHLLDFRKNISYAPPFHVPTIDTPTPYQLIYKCPFNKDILGICSDIQIPSFLKTSKNQNILLIPKMDTDSLLKFNIYTIFSKIVTTSTKSFDLNFICSTNEVNTYKLKERLLLNFPNANINFYNDNEKNIPNKNYITQFIDNHPIPLSDKDGNFHYKNIMSLLK